MNTDRRITLDAGGGSDVFCLDEIKDLLRVEHDYDNDRINLANRTAAEVLSGHAWIQLLEGTRTLRSQAFPACRLLYLPYPPLLTIESVKYLDLSETLQTVDDENYIVHTWHQPGVVQFRDEFGYPDVASRLDAVQVQYTCGYGTGAEVPPAVKEALFFLIKHLYDHPDMDGDSCRDPNSLPGFYRQLLNSFSMRDERVLRV